jgi:hypothetical protein
MLMTGPLPTASGYGLTYRPWRGSGGAQVSQAVYSAAAKADALIDEAIDAGHGGSDPLVVRAKMLRLGLLQVKADLERERGTWVLDYSACGRTVTSAISFTSTIHSPRMVEEDGAS